MKAHADKATVNDQVQLLNCAMLRAHVPTSPEYIATKAQMVGGGRAS